MVKVILGVFLALAGTTAVAAGLQPGNYSLTSNIAMAGMPPRSFTLQHCYTAADVKDPAAALARSNQRMQNQQCKVVNPSFNAQGGRFHISCDGQIQAQGDVTISYTGTGFQESMSMQMQSAAQGAMSMKTDVTATRLGACR